MNKTVLFAAAFVIVTILLGLFQFTENNMGKHWFLTSGKELFFAFYLFSLLFYTLDMRFGVIGDKFSKEELIHQYEISRIYHWGFMFAIPAYFALIVWFHKSDSFQNASLTGLRLLAFVGLSVVCIVIPSIVYGILRPLHRYHGERERLSPKKIVDIAKTNESFSRFVSGNPGSRIFVQNSAHRYRFARVCAAIRESVEGAPDVKQESVLEIQVDMRKKKPVEESEVFQTYLFRPEEEGFSVLVLPTTLADWQSGKTYTIDEPTLARLDTVPPRFPALDRFPLPIASAKKDAIEVAIPPPAAASVV